MTAALPRLRSAIVLGGDTTFGVCCFDILITLRLLDYFCCNVFQ